MLLRLVMEFAGEGSGWRPSSRNKSSPSRSWFSDPFPFLVAAGVADTDADGDGDGEGTRRPFR